MLCKCFYELIASNGQLTATEIYDHFQVSPQAISQHLKVLREANLVRVEKRAQQRIYQMNPDAMIEVEEWTKLTRLRWSQHFNFDALDKVLLQNPENMSL